MKRRKFFQASGLSVLPFLIPPSIKDRFTDKGNNERRCVNKETEGTNGYDRLWRIGTLDPARNKKWLPQESTEGTLAYIPVAPGFIQFTARGNPNNPSNIDCYEVSELKAGKAFSPKFGHGGEKTHLTLFVDLLRTIPGTIEIKAKVPNGTKMMIETGESMQPTRSYPVSPEAIDDIQIFKPIIAHGGWGSLRFAWIHFYNPSEPITIYDVRGICQILPCNYVGDFSCSDNQVTRVWEMCAYSAHAVMAQPLKNETQASKRLQTLCLDRVDRFPWAGDSRIIQTAVLDVFGQYDLIRSNLEEFIPKGTRPIPDLTRIAPYTLDWALAVINYYRYSGDETFFEERLEDLVAVIEKYDSVSPNWEEIKTPSGCDIWMFFDWDHRINRSVDIQTAAAFAGKYVQTCRELAKAAQYLNHPEVAQHADHLAQKHITQWQDVCLTNWDKTYKIHAVTNLLLGGILSTPKERDVAFEKVYADRSNRWTGTPYFGTYVLMALALINKHEEALEMLLDYWGSMIDAGATSVWEEWDPTLHLPVNCHPPQAGPPATWGTLSLIQPAGAGPVRWLNREILGITPQTPGFRQIRVAPHPTGLSWAKGTVFTPIGPVTASWCDDSKKFQIEVAIPSGCEKVELVVQPGKSYELDNRIADPTTLAEEYVTFVVSSGSHVLTASK